MSGSREQMVDFWYPRPSLQPSALHKVKQRILKFRPKSRKSAGMQFVPSELEEMRSHFNPAFYLSAYPDIAAGGIDPLRHFHETGWREHRDPSPEFSTRFYLEANPDVAAAGINPFWHYVVQGRHEGRALRPAFEPDAEPSVPLELEVMRPHFNPTFYLSAYPDIAAGGIDPLRHFHEAGWREHRDPSPEFSTRFYLEANPDVAAAGINPFWHYVVQGRHEGRAPVRPDWNVIDVLETLLPFEERVGDWLPSRGEAIPLSAGDLLRLLQQKASEGRDHLVLSVGHDNYRECPGGVQLCIHQEEIDSVDHHRCYLNLFPWRPVPRLAHEDEDPDPIVGLLLDGDQIGTCRSSTLRGALASGQASMKAVDVVIHHLMGHMPERIAELIEAANGGRCHFWVHDYFTLSPHYALQRNDVAFCGAPDRTSTACTICVYGEERQSHLRRLSAFFDRIAVDVLVPSEVTRDFWQSRTQLRFRSVTVVPHLRLDWKPRAAPAIPAAHSVVTVAFVGTPTPLKGWPVFQALAKRYQGGGRYRFIYFGTTPPKTEGIDHVDVHVKGDDARAMVDALAAAEVDLVLAWMNWPETFSFSSYEALAAGAYVVTNPLSGNVAQAVEAMGHGAVLADQSALMRFFDGPGALGMAEEARAHRASREAVIERSAMSHPFLSWKAMP